MAFRHITSDPKIMNGRPTIKGTQISVDTVMEWITCGAHIEDILMEHPQLRMEAIREVLRYATRPSA